MATSRSDRSSTFLAIHGFLEHPATRLLLSVAIIASLLPSEQQLIPDPAYLVLFGPELVLRLVLALRSEVPLGDDEEGTVVAAPGWRFPRPRAVVMLSLDLVANLSFLPLGSFANARWLRLFRLSRTIMLIRLWGPFIRDLRTVILRRERARQVAIMGVAVATAAFAGTVILNNTAETVGDDFDGDGHVGDEHDHDFSVRLWWSFRQIQDPGNMLASPHETGTLFVSIGLTVFGLFLVSFLIGLGTDVVQEVMEISKLRPTGMRGHTVVINVTPSTRQLLFEMLRETEKHTPRGKGMGADALARLRTAITGRDIVVVGQEDEPPEFLREPEFMKLAYRHDPPDDDELFITRADLPSASRVVLLAPDADDADDETIRTLLTIVERMRVPGPGAPPVSQLFAEVKQESNLHAVQHAIRRADGRVMAQLVPTERLQALFLACVARRPGIAPILLELLNSRGYELYTHDYEEDGTPVPGAMRGGPAAAVDALFFQGLSQAGHRILPMGTITAHGAGPDRRVEVSLNPTRASYGDGERPVGFVALAHNARLVQEFARAVGDSAPPPPRHLPQLPPLEPAAETPLERVIILGFRPAMVSMIEAIMTAAPDAEILVVVEDEEARGQAETSFATHAHLVRHGLREATHGTFEPAADGEGWHFVPTGGVPGGMVWIEEGDTTASHFLLGLPHGFGRVTDNELLVLVSSRGADSDARATTTLMKLEELQAWHERQHGTRPQQRIVAEVFNRDLGGRLYRRYEDEGRDDIRVFSAQELRALFMFQSVAVSHFDQIYSELVAPWGQSIVRLRPAMLGQGRCTFSELATALRGTRRFLLAVEHTGDSQVVLAAEEGSPESGIDLARLAGVWVIQHEPGPGERATLTVDLPTPPPRPPATSSSVPPPPLT